MIRKIDTLAFLKVAVASPPIHTDIPIPPSHQAAIHLTELSERGALSAHPLDSLTIDTAHLHEKLEQYQVDMACFVFGFRKGKL